MTDERLEQILKQALSPEVSEEDIRIRKEDTRIRKEDTRIREEDIRIRERKNGKNMNKAIKRIIAAAACVALVAMVGIGSSYRNGLNTSNGANNSNPFVITAHAAELDSNHSVPVVFGGKQSWSLSTEEDGDAIFYDIEADFSCQGENIDTITYSINEGAFDVSELADKSILVDEVAYSGADASLTSGGIGFETTESGDPLSTSRLLQSYTVKYDAQTNDTTGIGICGEKTVDGAIDTIWNKQRNYEEEAAVFDKLLDGVEITCTVNYTDGTSASQVITLGGQVMTYEEAGMCEEGFTYDNGENWQTNGVFFVFRLK